MSKRCPKCGGRMFLQYGTGYKGNNYDYGCLNCGLIVNAGDRIPGNDHKSDMNYLFKRVR